MAIKVMQEVGIDSSKQKSKNISEIPIDKIDMVVTLCGDAAENCSIFPGKVERIHWEIEDPAKAPEKRKRNYSVISKVRDNIKSYIVNYLLVK